MVLSRSVLLLLSLLSVSAVVINAQPAVDYTSQNGTIAPMRSELNHTMDIVEFMSERVHIDPSITNITLDLETTTEPPTEPLGNGTSPIRHPTSIRGEQWDGYGKIGGRVGSSTTDTRPAATARGQGLNLCWTNGQVSCTYTEDFITWQGERVYVGGSCSRHIVGTVALAASDRKTGNDDVGLYMYGRSDDNKLFIMQWRGDFPGWGHSPQCPEAYTDGVTMAYDVPAAMYIDRYPNEWSFVLVITKNIDGNMEYFLDRNGYHSPQKLVRMLDTNEPLALASTASMARIRADTAVAVYYAPTSMQDPPRVFRVKYWYYLDNWQDQVEIHSIGRQYQNNPYPFVPRIAYNIDLTYDWDETNIMMWTKHDDTIMVDVARGEFPSIWSTDWENYEDFNDDRPGSDCSELVTLRVFTWSELWTACFYRGDRDGGIWYAGIKSWYDRRDCCNDDKFCCPMIG